MNVIESFRLSGRVAVVTGGAGLYGRQVVEALAEAGASTYMASRNVAKLNDYAVTLRERGLEVSALHLDQSREESIVQLLDQVVQREGEVDILVNNAVLQPMKEFDSPVEDFELSLRINATGPFLLTRAFGFHMAEKRHGSIINIGSIKGMVGPDLSLYEGLSWNVAPDYFYHKGGMLQLTRYAAAKLGPHGVRVNTISPGGFQAGQEPIFIERYCRRTFLGRMANESDLKGAVVFLASDASAYVTGVNLPVDAGYTAV